MVSEINVCRPDKGDTVAILMGRRCSLGNARFMRAMSEAPRVLILATDGAVDGDGKALPNLD